jgi:hypothetical protein
MDTAGVGKASQAIADNVRSNQAGSAEKKEERAHQVEMKAVHDLVMKSSSEIVDSKSFEKVVGEHYGKLVGQGAVFPFDKTFFEKYFDYLKDAVSPDDAAGARLKDIAEKYLSSTESDIAAENSEQLPSQPIDQIV